MILTVSRVVLLIGIVLIVLAAASVQFGPMDLFKLGAGIAFAAVLVP